AAPALDWPDLSDPADAEGGGESDVAVIVGVEGYSELPRIPGAGDNAEGWDRYLTAGRSVPRSRVALLEDKKGTGEKLLKAIRQEVALSRKGGTFWLIFIGHGAPGSDQTGGLLVGYDAQAESDSLEERGLGQKELLSELAKGKQSRVVAVLDTG